MAARRAAAVFRLALSAAAFLLPLLSRAIGTLGVPLAPFVLALLLALIVRRAAEVAAEQSEPRFPVNWTPARIFRSSGSLPRENRKL